MTFAEAFAKLCALAPGYCSLRVRATRTSDGSVDVAWDTYDGELDWSNEYSSADEALAAYQEDQSPPPQTVDGIDPIPEATT